MTTRLTLRSGNVVTPEGVRPATIHVGGERIERIGGFQDVSEGETLVDYGTLTIMPGIVDSHVHVNEPGRTEWEGFETATRAAAAGGVTTIVDMPLNSIPATTSVHALEMKIDALRGKCRVDVALWGGAVPGNAGELRPMLDAGAVGFKCFLVDSGVPEFGNLDAEGLKTAMLALRDTGAPLIVHAEVAGPIEQASVDLRGTSSSYRRYLESRPRSAENDAIALVYELARECGAKAHIVHLSSSGGLEYLRRAREKGVSLTAETTPHYLYFDAERIPDGRPEYKCAPPIREHSNREQLWQGIADGLITLIVSDHSPCTPELKHLENGDVEHAWGGISSLQFGLSIVWTEAKRRGISIEKISNLMSAGPAKLACLDTRKGKLASGFDADIVVWDPDATFVVDAARAEHRHKVTPYDGETLSGIVRATYLRGRRIWEDGHVDSPKGKWIRP